MLGLLRYLARRSPWTIWFRLNIKGWSKSNGRCYQTGLKAIQDLATASGDFDPPKGRKRVPAALPLAVELGAKEFKFRCLQVKGKGGNASFVWHVAPRGRLLWDKEPLFYLRDRKTERHVRRQLRAVDIEITGDGTVVFGSASAWLQMDLNLEVKRIVVFEQLELGLKIVVAAPRGQMLFTFCDRSKSAPLDLRVVTPSSGDAEPKLEQAASQIPRSHPLATDPRDEAAHYRIREPHIYEKKFHYSSFSNTTPAPPDCSQKGLVKLRRKAHVLLSEVELIHECSTGKVPCSKGHAISFLLKGLQEGYSERRLLRSYRKAHEFATAYVCDGLARAPLAVLLWRAKWELKRSDNLTRGQRMEAFYGKLEEAAVEMEKRHLTGQQPGQAADPHNAAPACSCNRNAPPLAVEPSPQTSLRQSAATGVPAALNLRPSA